MAEALNSVYKAELIDRKQWSGQVEVMAEALNSVYKAELIDRKQWSGQVEVMAETSRWVGWYNAQRLHSALGYKSPAHVHQQWTERTLMDVAAA